MTLMLLWVDIVKLPANRHQADTDTGEDGDDEGGDIQGHIMSTVHVLM